MEILGAGGTSRANQLYFRKVVERLKAAGIAPADVSDEVEISDVGRFLSFLSSLPQIRQDKVDALRRQIDADEYDIESKLEEIIDDLLEDIGVPHQSMQA